MIPENCKTVGDLKKRLNSLADDMVIDMITSETLFHVIAKYPQIGNEIKYRTLFYHQNIVIPGNIDLTILN